MSISISQLADDPNIATRLMRGSSDSDAIKTLQSTLYELGYGTILSWERFGADGQYGQATQKAVLAFIQQNGLVGEGVRVTAADANLMSIRHAIAGPLRILAALESPDQTLKKQAKGSAVAALQVILNFLEYGEELKWARFGADGDYGGATTAAVAAFAQQESQSSDGTTVTAVLRDLIVAKVGPLLGPDWQSVKENWNPRPQGQSQFALQGRRLHPAVTSSFGSVLNFEKFSHQLEQDNTVLDFYQVSRKDGSAKYHFDQRVEKKKVVLHFTAGQITGDLSVLTNPAGDPVSTAFVIGYDGAIYRLFGHVEYWAWHLGSGSVGTNRLMSPTSIGIEVSNWGPLRKSGDHLETWDHGHYYCDLADADAYYELAEPYRGASYFARPTDAQYDSLILLLRYLTEDKSNLGTDGAFIPVQRSFREVGKRGDLFTSDEEAQSYKGICCHTNFRATGKWDYPEAGYDWDRIVNGVMGPLPAHLKRSRSLLGGPKIMNETSLENHCRGLNCATFNSDDWGEDGPEESR